MKILFVIDDLFSGGAQRQMVSLALALRKEDHQITVLTYFSRDFYGDILQGAGIQLKCLAISNPIMRILVFRKYIRKGDFNVVISYLGIPVFISELASIPYRKWKLIVNERSANPVILKSPKSILIRIFHLLADHVVSNSFANRDIVLKVNPFVPRSKMKVIYNMLDLDNWRPSNDFEFRKDGKLTIVVAASHRYLKNFMGLLKAVLLLGKPIREQIRISWYGNNMTEPYYDNSIVDCRNFIKDNKLSHLIEFQPASMQIKEAMLIADVIGLFSFFEGLPNAVCEGMALGKPILASAVSDVPLLIEDEVNGKLCNPNDVSSIAEGLRYLISQNNSVLEKMGKRNRAKAIELFDQKKILAQYLELIK